MTSSDVTGHKIASAGGIAARLSYPKASRGYRPEPKRPLSVAAPSDALGYPLRVNPVSFGDHLQGRISSDKRLKTFRVPEAALEIQDRINTGFAPASEPPTQKNYSGQLLAHSERAFLNPNVATSVKTSPVGHIRIVETPTPDIIPKFNFVKFMAYEPPPKAPVQLAPAVAVELLGESRELSYQPPPKAPVQLEPAVGVSALREQQTLSLRPRRHETHNSAAEMFGDVSSLVNPTVVPLTTGIAKPNVQNSPRMNEESPIVFMTQPIIPFSSSLNITRNLTTKHRSKNMSRQNPRDMLPPSKINLNFFLPPKKSSSSEQANLPVPVFALSTLKPDKFQIR